MAISDDQYNALLARLTALELGFNDCVTAINNLASVQQVNSMLVVIQTSLASLQTTVNTLNDRIEALEEESFE